MGSTDEPSVLARQSTRVKQIVRCQLVPADRAGTDLANAVLDLADGEEIVAVSTMEGRSPRAGLGVHVTLVTRVWA